MMPKYHKDKRQLRSRSSGNRFTSTTADGGGGGDAAAAAVAVGAGTSSFLVSSSSSSSLEWRKVHVNWWGHNEGDDENDGGGGGGGIDDNDPADMGILNNKNKNKINKQSRLIKNHYDDRTTAKHAEQDLEAAPGEDIAMFYGLEVLDGNAYRVVPINDDHDDGNDDDHRHPSKEKSAAPSRLMIVPCSKGAGEDDEVTNATKSNKNTKRQQLRKQQQKQEVPTMHDLSQRAQSDDQQGSESKEATKGTAGLQQSAQSSFSCPNSKRKRSTSISDANDDDRNKEKKTDDDHDDDDNETKNSRRQTQLSNHHTSSKDASKQDASAPGGETNDGSETMFGCPQQETKANKKKTKTKNNQTETLSKIDNDMIPYHANGASQIVIASNDQDLPPHGLNDATAISASSVTSATATMSTAVLNMQHSWMMATGGVVLHPVLCQALVQRGFWIPTPIQAATLPASILGRRNIIGAAPTGSGKTFAFLLPIAQALLESIDASVAIGDDDVAIGDDDDDVVIADTETDDTSAHHTTTKADSRVQALIVTPTRELALQIHVECQQLFLWNNNESKSVVTATATAATATTMTTSTTTIKEPSLSAEDSNRRDNDHDDGCGTNNNNNNNSSTIMMMRQRFGRNGGSGGGGGVPVTVVVGGLAHVKQMRMLDMCRPLIVVGTPGRLWDLISSRQCRHLNDLSGIRFLILDEADRMVQAEGNVSAGKSSFPELTQILDAVQRANPRFLAAHDDKDNDDDDDTDDHDGDDQGGSEKRLVSLPGLRGEAKVTMLSDEMLQHIHTQQEGQGTAIRTQDNDDEREGNAQEDLDGESFDVEQDIGLEDPVGQQAEKKLDEDGNDTSPIVQRQTFIFSATLTLPASASYRPKAKKRQGLANKKNQAQPVVDGGIAEILEKSRARGKTKIVDLTNGDSNGGTPVATSVGGAKTPTSTANGESRFPPGLRLQQIKCTQRHKDSHLYAYLLTTQEGASGPCLVFCNSIAGVRRVGATLQTLGLQVRTLHAHMQQRARFKAVESLRASKARVIVVATDVAARGLDIPSVSTVVHYDAARTVDSFIHRSGRTARGMGETATGTSLSLVSSDEDRIHSSLVKSLKVRFEDVTMDGRLLSGAQERVNLATKVVMTDEIECRSQRSNRWFLDKANEAGLEVDADLLEGGLASGDRRDQQQLRQAHAARTKLQELLSQPLQTQRFGKFLSTNSAARVKIPEAPPVVTKQWNRIDNKQKSRGKRRR